MSCDSSLVNAIYAVLSRLDTTKVVASTQGGGFVKILVPAGLAGVVGLFTILITWVIANKNTWADVIVKGKDRWKEDIIRLFSTIEQELHATKDGNADHKKVFQAISQIRLLLNVNKYNTHKKLESELSGLNAFLAGKRTDISDYDDLVSHIDAAREAVYCVCKEAWDDIQRITEKNKFVKWVFRNL